MGLSKIKYICLKGGGVKLFAHIGGLQALSDKGIYSQIKGFAGTSAGAIIAGLCAIGYTPKEIESIVMSYDLKKFEDKTIWSSLMSPFNMGICEGKYFLNVIKKAIKDKTGNDSFTFTDLNKAGLQELKVYATATDRIYVLQEFSFEQTPNVSIADAIRASMSIPGIYRPYKINGQYYFDGGIVLNYPINAFDDRCKCNSDEVLGFFFYDNKDYRNDNKNKLRKGQPIKAALQVFKAGLDSQDINTLSNYETMSRTIKIDTLGVSSTDFDIIPQQKQALIESGKNAIN